MSKVTLETATQILKDLELDDERCNERSVHVFLSLAKLKVGDDWSFATNDMQGTREIMNWIADKFGVNYKPNTRETIRRFTLHQFVQAGLVIENDDDPARPKNSPKWNYRLNIDILNLIKSHGASEYQKKLIAFKKHVRTWLELQIERKDLLKVEISMPGGVSKYISAGGQNNLIKSIVEEFCSRFIKNGQILFIGDASKENEIVDQSLMKSLGITLPQRGKEPDVIAWDPDRKWLYLIEACSTHGPIDVTRKQELLSLFSAQKDKLILVSCFPNRKIMQKYLSSLAWESECWCEDTPDHMIHLNGDRFLGPHK